MLEAKDLAPNFRHVRLLLAREKGRGDWKWGTDHADRLVAETRGTWIEPIA